MYLENGDIQGIRNAVADIYVDDSIYELCCHDCKLKQEAGTAYDSGGFSDEEASLLIAMAKAEAFLQRKYIMCFHQILRIL